jgi:ribosome maturation factor RimP
MGIAEDVERIVAPLLSSIQIEVVDVEAAPGRVQVTVDRAGGLDLEGIGRATRVVSDALDTIDVVPGGRYELEVSSPGVERRLRRPEHFGAVIGTEIAIKLLPGATGERRFEALLTAADDTGIVVEAGSPVAERRIPYSEIDRAHTIFDWRAALAAGPAEASSTHSKRREARPSAAERSRAAASTRRNEPKRDSVAGSAALSPNLPAAERDTTETP